MSKHYFSHWTYVLDLHLGVVHTQHKLMFRLLNFVLSWCMSSAIASHFAVLMLLKIFSRKPQVIFI